MAGLYNNAPLQSATFEARFHGNLAIESRRAEFQQLLKPEYPLLFVPHAAVDKSPALQHYQFRKEDGSAVVMLAVNSFVYACNRYLGFDTFKKEVEQVWEKFSSIFDISTYTRLGLRYVNHLPIIKTEEGAIPLSRYVTTNVQVISSLAMKPIFDIGLSIVSGTGDGQMRLVMQNEHTKAGVEVLILDFDFYRVNTEKGERQSFIQTAHDHIERQFLELISPDYIKIMKGGQDEQG